jgi:hypothetical protein
MSNSVRHVVSVFAGCARAEILRLFLPNSCVASTRITIDVMTAFGLTARPLEVAATVHNSAYLLAEAAKGGPLTDDEERAAFQISQALTLELGHEKSPDGIGGHVVTIVDNAFLVDASLDQANRPEYRISLPSVFVGDMDNPLPGPAVAFRYLVRDCGLEYRARKVERDFRSSADWKESPESREVVARIVARMTRYLKSAENH